MVFASSAVLGHEMPNDVTVQIIAKPGRDRMQLLVRVPLEAMQDIELPTIGPGYIDLARAEPVLRNSAQLWLANDIEIYEGETRLPRFELVAVQASIPSDRSFTDFATALAHVRGPPLPQSTQLVWQQALLDVLFEVPIQSQTSLFAIHPRLARLGLRVTTALRFVTTDGAVRAFRIVGDEGVVRLDPRWHESLRRFVVQGFEHILDGADHLLFLLCLIVPLRRELRKLVWTVTAFTAGHSLTLIAAAYGAAPVALWFAPLIETLIAASIFYMAIENVVVAASAATQWARTRWAMAFGFGLVHGFGFSFALRDSLQFAGDHVLTSLLSFNVGIELGQLLVIALLVPVLNLLFRYIVAEQIGVIVLSVIVGHTAWHWMADRFALLRQFNLSWADVWTQLGGAGTAPWAAAAVLAAMAVLVWRGARQRRKRSSASGQRP